MGIKDVIVALGGVRSLARKLGHKNHTTVQGWWERGVIPAQQQAAVLGVAAAAGVHLHPGDLIPGLVTTKARSA